MRLRVVTTVRSYTTNRMDHWLSLLISGRIWRFLCRWLSAIAVFQERELCCRGIKNHTKLSHFSVAVPCVCDFIVKVWHIWVPIPIGPQRGKCLIYLEIKESRGCETQFSFSFQFKYKINVNYPQMQWLPHKTS